MDLILKIHLASTLIMVGVIWVVQLVHYPVFHFIDENSFEGFEQFHVNKISFIVVPTMLLEAASAATALIYLNYQLENIAGIILLAFIWGVTFFVSIPCHNELLKSKDKKSITRLVNSNWIRTILWSIRGGLVLWSL